MYWPKCLSYGRWGAPGLSGGRWTDNPADIPWGHLPPDMLPIDEMDAAFMDHDYAYQHGTKRWVADLELARRLWWVNPSGWRANAFWAGAMLIFGTRGYIGMLLALGDEG